MTEVPLHSAPDPGTVAVPDSSSAYEKGAAVQPVTYKGMAVPRSCLNYDGEPTEQFCMGVDATLMELMRQVKETSEPTAIGLYIASLADEMMGRG